MDMVGHKSHKGQVHNAPAQRHAAAIRPAGTRSFPAPDTGSATCRIQITIHPDESRSRRELAGGRIHGLWETAVKMPGHEEPLSFRMVVRQAARLWRADLWVEGW